ncbi:tRNA (adenosine(37)-N6)-threonylcarbamoyltransferase complex dimerization subunit type 1 TsaB [Bacillus fonticola]|uniref:tRNA (adenosine(37)-N6)-threonylcarbamoyltransferase complex dimerization subunit type 1 TsaB n=1 Tax=Bacillus fonticola TaxID=2728853 RepID=UPI001472B78C|nr:tRNA (adenosine(37)-N6)-threonylcarbamoyltransferase complex dimerization subunit type 1 TsaB [Bacillus fonticola]
MTILAIDTSHHILSVALRRNGSTLGELTTFVKQHHSVRAMPAIEQLMTSCGIDPSELTKIVVAEGPGSYTGLRIGGTIAKTMAWSLQIPLVGISSLAALAGQAHLWEGLVLPFFDARRGTVFTGLYRRNESTLTSVEGDRHVNLAEWIPSLRDVDEHILIISDAIATHREVFEQHMSGDLIRFAPVDVAIPRASVLAQLGENVVGVSAHAYVPQYRRLPEAEVNWLRTQKEH